MNSNKWILFDKDGTLIQFDESWTKIGIQLVDDVCDHFQLEHRQAVYRAIGIKDGRFEKDSVMNGGTLKDLIAIFQQFSEVEMAEWIAQRSQTLISQRVPEIELYEGVASLVQRLKAQGYALGIVTSDNHTGVTQFLEQTQLTDVFDMVISTNDGQYEKPDIRLLQPLWERGVRGEDVIMVGDTDNDMLTGKNMRSALNVGVRTGLGQEAKFEAADVVIDHVGLLENVLSKVK
ncbi:HAD family hydrolase [Staphylococcus ursi]|uniref:HAD family hydrolase n=1 Tax=Staphylococcus sp. MI 10-1553 TaxID=1912064 RepID=UPI0013972F8C|nr:HAD family hydrolase [Staphylococcus sp. MI 10-1553]QHW38046.1 HAD family hydrolase [Staphylococcus sp. MI 10-1553]